MLKDCPDVITVREMAKLLGVSINYAYKLLKEGAIGYRKVGHRIIVPKICVEDFFESARIPTI
ncbi:MAG: helix-turn-helix domain-containing protein [Oscillospiraceae bacterium]|nr:helix-turn-helix domain-containing protein [Oscillospiraceae bacterium]MBR6657509.1 helix-turn-helix domain-containing protein [Oscillospiraceae bacterium]